MRSVVLRVAAVCSAVSWLLFPGFGIPDVLVTAVAMYRANRRSVPVDITFGVDHYAVQGALAVALVALLAALWQHGRRYLGVSTGVAGAHLGLVSLAWPGAAGGYGPVCSAVSLARGVAVLLVAVTAPPGRLLQSPASGEPARTPAGPRR